MLAHIDRRVFRPETFPALTTLEIHDQDFGRVAELIDCVGPQLRSLSLALAMWMHPRRLPSYRLVGLRELTLFVDPRLPAPSSHTPRVPSLRKLVIAEQRVRGRDEYLAFTATAERLVHAIDGLALSRYRSLEVLYFDVVARKERTFDEAARKLLHSCSIRDVHIVWRQQII